MVDLDRMKELARIQGLKQKELFAMVGRKEWYGGDIKKGVPVPDRYVQVWAEALHTTPAYLMGETDDPEIKKAPTLAGEHSKEAQEFAADFSDFTPDEWAELRRYADFLKSQRSDEWQK